MPWWIAALDVVVAVASVAIWYVWFVRVNRKRAVTILQWICTAAAGQGRVARVVWLSSSRFVVTLQLRSHCFHHARVTVRLAPREMPVEWMLSRWRKQRETFTFDADLDCPPGFNLEVRNYRWKRRPEQPALPDPSRLVLVRTGPIVLTTRGDWQHDLTNMMNGLLSSRDCDFETVQFRRTSPHFSATMPLQSLELQPECPSHLFDTLRELATGASAAMF